MIKVLYIDLGCHKGDEINFILDNKNCNIDFDIVGFEANSVLAEKLMEKYKNNSNITIHNKCITDKDDEIINLKKYRSTSSTSIYTKNNVAPKGDSIKVKSVKLSSILKKINLDIYDVKVLKSNIEGAEYNLLKDLNESNMFIFDLYLGSGQAPYAILEDIHKFKEIKGKMQECKQILKKHNIESYRFAPRERDKKSNNPKHKNVNINEMIIEKFNKCHEKQKRIF